MAEEEGQQGIEQQLERAICSRIKHFKDQADSLTMESVRRLLEKDLSLEKFALDAHKRFIRHYLEKKMDDTDVYNSKAENENVDKDVSLNKLEETVSPKPNEKNNLKKSSTGNDEIMEDSPILGVLTPKCEVGTQGSPISESKIEKAIRQRSDHFLANSENITLAGVRRLLEEDLGLEINTLDVFKKFISQQIDQVLNPPKGAKSADDKKRSSNLKSKSSKSNSKEVSKSSGSESDEMEDKVKSNKEVASRRNIKKSEQPKKRKLSQESELDGSSKKKKISKRQKKEDSDSAADGSLSEDGQSQSPIRKSAQNKEKPAPGYGKKVENLKSIIKACGMSVAPTVYKKAKQVPDNERETFLIKELKEILSREGLSTNPTEKEIKNCRKRKETARELEGIDMSNIISSSRRRSTFNFMAPEKPEIHAKKDKASAKESKKDKAGAKESKGKDSSNEQMEEEKGEKDKEKQEKEEKKKDGEEEEVGDVEEEEGEGEGEGEEEEVEDDDDDEEEEDDESEEFNEDDYEDSD